MSIKYKGLDFTGNFQHAHQSLNWDWQGHGNTTERQFVDMATLMNGGLIVTGFDPKSKASSYFKKKVKEYMRQQSISVSYAILTDNDLTSPWLTWIPRIDADTIKDIKLPKDPNAVKATKNDPTYDVYRVDASVPYTGVKYTTEKVVQSASNETLVYVSPADYRDLYHKSGTTPQDIVKKLGSDYVLIPLAKNRFEKFLRNYPKAITLNKAFKDKVDFIVNSTTDNEFLVGKLEPGEKSFLLKSPPSKLKDPELADLAKLVQSNVNGNKYADAIELSSFARKCDISLAVPERKNVNKIVNPARRYPLINHMGSRQMDHLIVYVNAVYEQEYAQP